jgi:hypothetical protein
MEDPYYRDNDFLLLASLAWNEGRSIQPNITLQTTNPQCHTSNPFLPQQQQIITHTRTLNSALHLSLLLLLLLYYRLSFIY